MPSSIAKDYAFMPVWLFTGMGSGTLTCLAVSPKATRMIVASKEHKMMVVSLKTGLLEGTVSFEGQFYVKSALFYTEDNLITGGSNRSIYYVCLTPTLRGYSVTMQTILPERLPYQVSSLALDMHKSLLAVGYGTSVSLLKRECDGLPCSWTQLQLIPGPLNDKSALVSSLLFFPTPSSCRSLLVTYTEAGWGVWDQSGDVRRTDPATNHGVCRIGTATLSADERTIAISTLDQAIVTYPLDSNGPVLAGKKEYANPQRVPNFPVVPVALTQDGLALGGTTVGEVLVVPIDANNGERAMIRHEDGGHIIRALVTYGNRVIVGSTNPHTNTSVVTCYDSSTEGGLETVESRGQTKTFYITVTEAIQGWDDEDCAWPTATPLTARSWIQMGYLDSVRVSPQAMLLLCTTVLVVLMLSADPPNGKRFNVASMDSTDTGVLKPTMERHNYWVSYGVRHFARYLVFQITHWTAWAVSALYSFVVMIFGLGPSTFAIVTNGVGKWIGDRVERYHLEGFRADL